MDHRGQLKASTHGHKEECHRMWGRTWMSILHHRCKCFRQWTLVRHWYSQWHCARKSYFLSYQSSHGIQSNSLLCHLLQRILPTLSLHLFIHGISLYLSHHHILQIVGKHLAHHSRSTYLDTDNAETPSLASLHQGLQNLHLATAYHLSSTCLAWSWRSPKCRGRSCSCHDDIFRRGKRILSSRAGIENRDLTCRVSGIRMDVIRILEWRVLYHSRLGWWALYNPQVERWPLNNRLSWWTLYHNGLRLWVLYRYRLMIGC